jgi:hypothetical protein
VDKWRVTWLLTRYKWGPCGNGREIDESGRRILKARIHGGASLTPLANGGKGKDTTYRLEAMGLGGILIDHQINEHAGGSDCECGENRNDRDRPTTVGHGALCEIFSALPKIVPPLSQQDRANSSHSSTAH